jgi:hypothetical protein
MSAHRRCPKCQHHISPLTIGCSYCGWKPLLHRNNLPYMIAGLLLGWLLLYLLMNYL